MNEVSNYIRDLSVKAKKAEKAPTPVEFIAMDSAASSVDADISMRAVGTVQQWCETDDLDEGEGLGDRLLHMFVGIADENKDGELDDDEQAIVGMAVEAAYDYMVSKGVSEDDAVKLLEDFDNDVAARVKDLIVQTMPEGKDEDVESFVFDQESTESALDAVYKKTMVVRKGRKMLKKKRISGAIYLTSKQRMGIRKAGLKSHSAKAMMRRAKSNRVRAQVGL
jgi:hypothetical protein